MQEMYQNYVEGADDWDVPRVSHNPNPRKKTLLVIWPLPKGAGDWDVSMQAWYCLNPNSRKRISPIGS